MAYITENSIIQQLNEDQKFHLKLIATLLIELTNEQIITPNQKMQISNYMLDQMNKGG